ncbi:MAG TPA: post-COAP-1 domain-containing protein [Terriglobales bacterium]|nr:post-COAP-1 domain-containing protein [Terriglobales bacterium]
MRSLHLRLWCLIATLLAFAVCAFAQTTNELMLGSSVTDFDLTGGGPNTASITLSINTAAPFSFTDGSGLNVVCSAGTNGGYLLACGSASGSGTLSAVSTGNVAAYYVLWSPAQTPITLVAASMSVFSVQQTAPIYFFFSSAQGTLTGSLALDSVVAGEGNSAQALGTLTSLGGTFASVFSTGQADVTLGLATAETLQSLVGTRDSISAQVEFPGTIVPSSSPTCDFLTGGGWIPNAGASGPGPNPGAGNGKATFAIEGGCKNGSGWGHLNYIDHGSRMHVVGRAAADCATAYQVVSNGPPNSNGQPTGCRRMQGSAEINGQPGFTYTVVACDNGEPGTNDTFSVTLSNGYANSATLGGGNIQLHKGNRSFCDASVSNCPSQ